MWRWARFIVVIKLGVNVKGVAKVIKINGRGGVVIKIGVAQKGAHVSLLKIKWRKMRRFFSRIFLLSPKVMAVHHLLLPHPFFLSSQPRFSSFFFLSLY